MTDGRVVCCFPGCGRRYAIEHLKDICKVVSVDINEFKWLSGLLAQFGLGYPRNFANHIKQLRKTYDIILLTTESEVRSILKTYDIPYDLVLPDISRKAEFIGRAYINHYNDDYLRSLANEWEQRIKECSGDNCNRIWILHERENVSDYVRIILRELEEVRSANQ